jgi:hypothetical protein
MMAATLKFDFDFRPMTVFSLPLKKGEGRTRIAE